MTDTEALGLETILILGILVASILCVVAMAPNRAADYALDYPIEVSADLRCRKAAGLPDGCLHCRQRYSRRGVPDDSVVCNGGGR